MNIVRFEAVSLEYGEHVLLRDADLLLESGERVCLVGRNGAGKTTTFNLINGSVEADRGVVERKPGLRIAELSQALPGNLELSVHEVVASGLQEAKSWRDEYERLAIGELKPSHLKRLETLQQLIDSVDGWQLEQRVDAIITELNLPADKPLSELSAGWRRRVGLARALISKPELLLLDEPTNHLDFSTVEWLENRILGFAGSVLFITHDRGFLSRLATRILELDRGRLVSWPGNYERFLVHRDKALAEEVTKNALFDKRLAQEEVWIREGIKARRTRNEGRVRALQTMRTERSGRINLQGSAKMQIDVADASGRKVIELKNVTQIYENHTLFKDFSLKVMRGDRLGLVGNNGAGKSTLIRIMLGEQSASAGIVKQGTNLEIGFFDPINTVVPVDQTVAEFVGAGRDFIDVGGKSKHIISYLSAFLFSPKRARTQIGSLSGGERNRVLLAQVFSKPSNLLVLDEPTNDLDVETLEVLEERLVGYSGTLLIVSHDRIFLDNVVTSVLVFEADGGVHEYVGGYSDWAKRGLALLELDNPNKSVQRESESTQPLKKSKPQRRKLSYKLQRELDALPDRLETMERTLQRLEEQSTQANFYTQPYAQTQAVLEKLTAQRKSLEDAMARWSELESLREQAEG